MTRRLAPLAAAVLVLVVGGCGSGAAAGGHDPASAVPRGALVYADATLRPSGSVRDGALSAAGKILRTSDPAARIRELVAQALSSDGPHVDYARDIDPWLGDRAGVWLDAPPRDGADPSGGAVVAVRDEDAAKAKVRELARRGGEKLRHASAGGVDYDVNGKGDAIAVHDGWLVAGSESSVRRELSMADGASLADTAAYRNAIADLPRDRLASYYLDTKRFFDLTVENNPSSAARTSALRSLFTADALRPVAGAFTADGDRLALEQVSHGTTGGPLDRPTGLIGGSSTPLLRELPDSWAALGFPKAGPTLKAVFSRFAGVFGGAAAESQLRDEYGIDLEQDVFSWMGDAAVFARGATPSSLDGGLVIQVTDEAKAAAAYGKLVGLARTRGGIDPQPVRIAGADAAFDLGLPQASRPLIFARGHGRVVLAYGRAAAAEAVAPSHTLGDSATYEAAKRALDGADPSMLVSMPSVVALIGASSGSDPGFRQAKPYLDAFDVIAAGAEQDGDTTHSRFVAGLR